MEVYDDGLFKIAGASGIPAIGPFKGRFMMMLGWSNLLVPVVFQQLGTSKGRFMMMLVCSKSLTPVVFQQLRQ